MLHLHCKSDTVTLGLVPFSGFRLLLRIKILKMVYKCFHILPPPTIPVSLITTSCLQFSSLKPLSHLEVSSINSGIFYPGFQLLLLLSYTLHSPLQCPNHCYNFDLLIFWEEIPTLVYPSPKAEFCSIWCFLVTVSSFG